MISHDSAALLHGLPLLGEPPARVHATRDRRSGARTSRVVHLHAAALEPDEVVAVDGVARHDAPAHPRRPRAHPVVRARRSCPPTPRCTPTGHARIDIDEALDRAARRPGNGRARHVLAFARPARRTLARRSAGCAIHRAGLPPPALQHSVRTAAGLFLGQVDFWWEEFATAGEFDGRVKYGRLLRPGQEPGDVVFAEKVREDAIRADGREVVRWIWPELSSFDGVARRIRAAFARGGRGRPARNP